MSASLQVLYPTDNGTTFDHEYYATKHMEVVGEAIGAHIESTVITKAHSGAPGAPAGFHVIATILFADQAALDAALAEIGPAVEDIANFYSGEPMMLIGEVLGS